jgi:hypothetical protein
LGDGEMPGLRPIECLLADPVRAPVDSIEEGGTGSIHPDEDVASIMSGDDDDVVLLEFFGRPAEEGPIQFRAIAAGKEHGS